MKLRFSALPILLLSVISIAQQSAQQDDPARFIKRNYTKREAMIPMRDGVKLYTLIYEPKDRSAKYPILMQRTPYSVGPYGPEQFPS